MAPKRQKTRSRRGKKLKYGKSNAFSREIHKLLKCISPDLSINALAMNVLNSFIEDLLQRIASEASALVHHTNKSTMGFDDIISATKLVITSPELCRYAILCAHRAVESAEE